ncbi:MAG TPA: TAXI family TRAP transporter solute-binding subunit [Hyphomicrobiaceae bacterium]|nr:TAXI family TRAP transporter solute-binding subunit [Hyphomicrobiaceae bacterium]
MRLTALCAGVLGAVLALFPWVGAGAQQKPVPSLQPPAQQAAAQYLARRDKLNQNTVTVVSGNPNGTYLYLAYDLSAVLDDGDELRVLPIVGRGGYQNMMDVLHLKGVDLGITQSNILSYLKKTGEFGSNIDQRVAFITKLYNEEMHVLAGAGITRLQDLSGKKVNFSDVGSGTQFSTRRIFELLGIRAEEVNVGQADGYQMVKSGEIAATILIAGKPTGSFAKFKLEPGMSLLPVPYTEALEQDYFPAKLTSEDYPALIAKGTAVDTIAIASVLAAYNWPRDTDRYRRVAAFVDAFFSKFPEFQKGARHAKWKETNLNSTLKGWKRFPAAEEWLQKNEKQATAAAAVGLDPELARAQAAKAAPNDPVAQQRLFQEFMDWAKNAKK